MVLHGRTGIVVYIKYKVLSPWKTLSFYQYCSFFNPQNSFFLSFHSFILQVEAFRLQMEKQQQQPPVFLKNSKVNCAVRDTPIWAF